MKLFECQGCGHLVYFENALCVRCGRALGYLPELETLSALEPEGFGAMRPLAQPDATHRFCRNAAHLACNWLTPAAAGEGEYCIACRLNRTIPDLDDVANLDRWQRLEAAKHRLVYALLRLGLKVTPKADEPVTGLAFDFLADTSAAGGSEQRVLTGHAEGLITINIAEADDAERERMRAEMGEPYRTLLGHFRHEVGHYYWERLVRDGGRLDACRETFGDERADYGDALQAYYERGAPPDWSERYVSAYASAHPWEDFAETWAHYLHIVDTLETAAAFGLRLRPAAGRDPGLAATVDFDAYRQSDFDTLIGAWLPLTYAVNSLNRSMGQPDLYPFVLAPEVIGKLGFIHTLLQGAADR